jgi:hypothetical protein
MAKLEDILVPHADGEWSSVNEPDAFVNVHFKRFTVLLSGYTIPTEIGVHFYHCRMIVLGRAVIISE